MTTNVRKELIRTVLSVKLIWDVARMRTVRQLITELEALAVRYGDETPIYIDMPGFTGTVGEPIHVRIGCNRIWLQSQYEQDKGLRNG